MPSTQTQGTVTDWGQLFLTPGSVAALSSLPNPLSLDLLQVYNEGGQLIVKVSKLGVVTTGASLSGTSECLFGRYYTRLQSTATLAAIFADVFSQNNARQDVIQLRSQGGHGVWHLDYLGVAYSS